MTLEACPDTLFAMECRSFDLEAWDLLPVGLAILLLTLALGWALVDAARATEPHWYPSLVTLSVGCIALLLGGVMAVGGILSLPPSLVKGLPWAWGGEVLAPGPRARPGPGGGGIQITTV